MSDENTFENKQKLLVSFLHDWSDVSDEYWTKAGSAINQGTKSVSDLLTDIKNNPSLLGIILYPLDNFTAESPTLASGFLDHAYNAAGFEINPETLFVVCDGTKEILFEEVPNQFVDVMRTAGIPCSALPKVKGVFYPCMAFDLGSISLMDLKSAISN